MLWRKQRRHGVFSYRDSSVYVNDQHASQEVPGQRIDIRGNLINAGFDFGEEGSHVFIVERESTGEESEEDYTTAPNVSCVSPVFHTVDDLGTGVVRTATTGFELERGRSEGGHSPIGELDQRRVERMYQYIFWLEIAVNDRESVGIVESVNDLFEERQGIEGGETTAVNEEIKEFATFDVFEYKVKFVFTFEDVVDA